jgi:23S rRNA pseudouridine1911/1915/1917 synthase
VTGRSRRLDLALIRRHPELGRRKARDVIEKGQVTVDGEMVLEPGRAVPQSAEVRWDPNRRARRRARLSLPILYQDDDLVIVDKPAGLLTVPTSPPDPREDTVLGRVAEYARHLNPRRPYVGLVHRLDRDTSGAVAFALRPAARRALIALLRERGIERVYDALVAGVPAEHQAVIDLPIGEAYRGGRRQVAREGEPSRRAVTRFRVRERFAGAARLEVTLETGRQHQIRVHLAAIGLPILGDPVYGPKGGARLPARAHRPILHARILAFRHPVTGRSVRVESAPPEDFERVLAALRAGASRASRGR